ncbi:hypothetical protein ACXA18_03190 [Riemerella anatipestifer]|uniref:hypothetical protein n=1 Tax=Riemerella anatipestifer TaxID=34085 RepID=UPI001372BC49|nr:hypothetical protein [Riemerella anatipestifer]NAV16659.1 hypothetical protein [Riemerella anatipestifer]
MTLAATTTYNTAIEFLKEEKKEINICISDYVEDSEMYGYNSIKFTNHFFKIEEHFVDWDEFYFGLNIRCGVDIVAIHRKATLEEPEEKELNIKDARIEVEVLWCEKWDDEADEHREYRLSKNEKIEIEDYLTNNIIIKDC